MHPVAINRALEFGGHWTITEDHEICLNAAKGSEKCSQTFLGRKPPCKNEQGSRGSQYIYGNVRAGIGDYVNAACIKTGIDQF
jgi:hypothetical protein